MAPQQRSDRDAPLDILDDDRAVRPSSPQFWRFVAERYGGEAVRELMEREFPLHAEQWTDPVSRRRFLALMEASLALAGMTGCGGSPQKIVPYARPPEEIIPGVPLFYATAFTLAGYATGVLVESHMGRPIKIEGNPDHPASLGATDAFAQASILGLYDPDRSRAIRYLGQPSTWVQAQEVLRGVRDRLAQTNGKGLFILTEAVTSPTLAGQLTALIERHPLLRWHVHEPAGHEAAVEGSRLAFGVDAQPVYTPRNGVEDQRKFGFAAADVIVSLDADFLSFGPGHLRYVHDFSARRRVLDMQAPKSEMNRLYVVESAPTSTGMYADHRFPLASRLVPAFTAALAAEVARNVQEEDADQHALEALQGLAGESLGPEMARKITALARDLTAQGRRGHTLILAGEQQPPVVHALVAAMNHVLGNVGSTLRYIAPVTALISDQPGTLAELAEALDRGEVETLLILGGNPVYSAPGDLELGQRLEQFLRTQGKLALHLSPYDDETSRLCRWHIPQTHDLEAWSDARAYDGTATIVQPLIAPLDVSRRSAHDLLAELADPAGRSGHDLVKEYWCGQHPEVSGNCDLFWRRALHEGLVEGTAFETKDVSLDEGWAARVSGAMDSLPVASTPPELVFRPDPTIHDGRFANNGWLQELPKPITKLTWDNVALMSQRTAERLGVGYELGTHGGDAYADVVELRLAGREAVRAPVWIVPGHADDSITVHLGYGRTRAGSVGTGVGFDVAGLRTWESPWLALGVEVKRTGERQRLACTQLHHLMHNRELVRARLTVGEYEQQPDFAQQHEAHETEQEGPRVLSLYPEHPYDGYKWGMAIDLSACVGCGACVAACQAENNIPVVGKEQVQLGREMHWLRIDTYYESNQEGERDPNTDTEALADVRGFFQPVPCMHCENAPCELVCPVEATVHSDEGLNEMVYNRCVGTRYCSNNCPYKVRRFNFLQYADYGAESLKLLHNPDVTVRTRGVMEKCTYCVQRISGARIAAEKEGRRIRDGEVVTACQAVCPAQAIVFGDLNDRGSEVLRRKASTLNYGLLEELNTRPRTTYLAAVKNRNPDRDLA